MTTRPARGAAEHAPSTSKPACRARRPDPRPDLDRRRRRRPRDCPATSAGCSRPWPSTPATSSPSATASGSGPAARGGDEGLIEKVEPRRGTITRGYRRHKHVLVANVDQILIVSALEEPALKLPLIDRYLISAEIGGVRPVIVLNKADLVDPALYQWVIGLYTQLGYETILTSAADGRGIDRLRALVAAGTPPPSRARAASARARS